MYCLLEEVLLSNSGLLVVQVISILKKMAWGSYFLQYHNQEFLVMCKME